MRRLFRSGVADAFAVGEQLQHRGLGPAPLLDLYPHRELRRRGTGPESIVHGFRGLRPLLPGIVGVQRGELLQRQGGAGLRTSF